MSALAAILFLMGLSLKIFQDRRDRDHVIESARAGFVSGTASDLRGVVEQLEGGLADHPDDVWLRGALALARTQQLAEFGEAGEEARVAVGAIEVETHDGALARGMLALDEGRLQDAVSALERARDLDAVRSLSPKHDVWVAGMLAIVDPTVELGPAIETIAATLGQDDLISNRRLLAMLYMRAGDGHRALAELGRARERSVAHMGMAADEALYNAVLRQNLGGVASVAEQLDSFELSARDRAHADLARGVVHIRFGETQEGLARIEKAWAALPGWDKLSRTLALEMAMEAADAEKASAWIDEAGLSAQDAGIFRAWVNLIAGDVMGALVDLGGFPQEHPRVALLQGLALVEQGRWSEAKPWLERADKLMPGRVDVEVARARTELRLGDYTAALRKLQGLAEEEPHAPRAWTGLGEAYLERLKRAPLDIEAGVGAAVEAAETRRLAKRAFEKAITRESLASEAHLQLGELADARRASDPTSPRRALEHFERAVEVSDLLPRYRERLAAYLYEIGYADRALSMVKELVERPGVGHETWTLAIRLAVVDALARERGGPDGELSLGLEAWFDRAAAAGADPTALERERGRYALLQGDDASLAEGIERLRQLLEENEDDIDTRIVYARLWAASKDRDRAVLALRRGLQLSSTRDHGRLYLEWGRIESRSGGRRKAASYGRAGWNKLRVEEDSPRALLEAADLAIRLLNRDKKPKPGLSVARALTGLVPYHSRAWTIRARAQLKANKAAEARESAEKALDLDGENAAAHELLGRCQLRFGHKERARESFERAIDLAKGTPFEADYRENLRRL